MEHESQEELASQDTGISDGKFSCDSQVLLDSQYSGMSYDSQKDGDSLEFSASQNCGIAIMGMACHSQEFPASQDSGIVTMGMDCHSQESPASQDSGIEIEERSAMNSTSLDVASVMVKLVFDVEEKLDYMEIISPEEDSSMDLTSQEENNRSEMEVDDRDILFIGEILAPSFEISSSPSPEKEFRKFIDADSTDAKLSLEVQGTESEDEFKPLKGKLQPLNLPQMKPKISNLQDLYNETLCYQYDKGRFRKEMKCKPKIPNLYEVQEEAGKENFWKVMKWNCILALRCATASLQEKNINDVRYLFRNLDIMQRKLENYLRYHIQAQSYFNKEFPNIQVSAMNPIVDIFDFSPAAEDERKVEAKIKREAEMSLKDTMDSINLLNERKPRQVLVSEGRIKFHKLHSLQKIESIIEEKKKDLQKKLAKENTIKENIKFFDKVEALYGSCTDELFKLLLDLQMESLEEKYVDLQMVSQEEKHFYLGDESSYIPMGQKPKCDLFRFTICLLPSNLRNTGDEEELSVNEIEEQLWNLKKRLCDISQKNLVQKNRILACCLHSRKMEQLQEKAYNCTVQIYRFLYQLLLQVDRRQKLQIVAEVTEWEIVKGLRDSCKSRNELLREIDYNPDIFADEETVSNIRLEHLKVEPEELGIKNEFVRKELKQFLTGKRC